jgi:iron complex transport system substrate-binding protein
MGLNLGFKPALFSLLLFSATAGPPLEAVDVQGTHIRLGHPARRIVSLAPHITELLFAAGAGDRIVGAVAYSDYPPAALSIPRVGSSTGIDLERVLALRPDLVLAWQSGSPSYTLEQLAKRGIPVYVTEPRSLETIAEHIRAFGRLAGTDSVAEGAAQEFLNRLSQLRVRYQGRRPVSAYYQIFRRPLMTVNGTHIISDVIRLCGGRNVFSNLSPLTPVVDTEAVLAANPDVIFASGPQAEEWLRDWRQWVRLRAVDKGHLFAIPEDWMARQGPRILLAAQQVCEDLEKVRRASG